MPRSALLRPKTEILAVSNNLCLELKCSKRKNRAAAKINFATAPLLRDAPPKGKPFNLPHWGRLGILPILQIVNKLLHRQRGGFLFS